MQRHGGTGECALPGDPGCAGIVDPMAGKQDIKYGFDRDIGKRRRYRLLLGAFRRVRLDWLRPLTAAPGGAQAINESLGYRPDQHAAKNQTCSRSRHTKVHRAANVLHVREASRAGRGRAVAADK